MITEPSILGSTIGWFFPSSIHGYYKLPSECLDFVIRKIGSRAREFAKKEGYAPCLFIDGADLLNKRLFIKLVDVAKGYANEGGLRIIFGCSEGHIIPIIHAATSSNSRCQILEVLDLEESDALQLEGGEGIRGKTDTKDWYQNALLGTRRRIVQKASADL